MEKEGFEGSYCFRRRSYILGAGERIHCDMLERRTGRKRKKHNEGEGKEEEELATGVKGRRKEVKMMTRRRKKKL